MKEQILAEMGLSELSEWNLFALVIYDKKYFYAKTLNLSFLPMENENKF